MLLFTLKMQRFYFYTCKFLCISSLNSFPLNKITPTRNKKQISAPNILTVGFFTALHKSRITGSISPYPAAIISYIRYSLTGLFCTFAITNIATSVATLMIGNTKSTDQLCQPVKTSHIKHIMVPIKSCHITFFNKLYLLKNPIDEAIHIVVTPPAVNRVQRTCG